MLKDNLITLTNGLTVVLQQDTRVHSVSVAIGVRAGSYYETKEVAGLAHFLEHMLFEGTKLYPTAKQLAEQIEKVGGYSSAYTDRGHVVYCTKVLIPHLEVAFQYLSQIIFKSTLATNAINREKGIVAEEINRTTDNPEQVIWENWMKWVWGDDQPLGRSIMGDQKTVLKITKTKLIEYLRNLYIPQNMILTVVGNYSPIEVRKYIQKYFNIKMERQVQVGQKSILHKHKIQTKIVQSDTQQVQLLFGFVTGVSYSHPDRYSMRLLSEILSGGVSARIFQKLIYKLGIAYSAISYDLELKDTGIFFISGGFAKENIERAINTIFDELKSLRRKKISDRELNNAKVRSIAQLYFSSEKPDDLANLYVFQFMTEGRITPIEELTKQINNVSADSIKKVVNNYFKNSDLYIMLRGQVGQDQVKTIDEIRESFK